MHVSGVVDWTEEPLTQGDIDSYYWRHASPLERAGIILRTIWDLTVAVVVCAVVTVLGGFVGLMTDPKGPGALVGMVAGFGGFWLVAWVAGSNSNW